MCKVLLPIKPKYAKEIFEGTKTVEYRKKKFKRNDVDKIVIYVTSPIKKVIGEVELLDIAVNTPLIIWDKTSQNGGIDKQSYDQYFKNHDLAVAYILGKTSIYSKSKSLKDLNINYYPQSYVYLD